ncbi:MAG TPA: type II toxin-antitoxin system VapC family toxin [Solirubrobacterales bacterium]|nr:type II toxin-antitoxin system VapC family toxin [Solirubrobacterales bacterium]
MSESGGKHQRGILDTSTLIHFNRFQEVGLLPEVSVVTTITLAELSVGPLIVKSEVERARRMAHLQQLEASFNPLPFDTDAARAFGSVAASLRQTGRRMESRQKDAMIAAIALANDLPVYTCNPRDFEGIDGLEVVPVPVPL